MSIININKIEEGIKKWLITVAIKKAIVRIAQLIISYLTAKGITIVYNGAPINVNTLTTILLGVFEIIRNFLKTKFPKYFSWL